ncbi:MAG: acyl carrier protein [Spartobacteria bacterium]
MNVYEVLTDYIRKEVLEKNGQSLPTMDEPLLDADGGVIDSMNLWPLIVFVESRFDVSFEDTELMKENFQTLGALITFIEAKQSKLNS